MFKNLMKKNCSLCNNDRGILINNKIESIKLLRVN